MPSILFCMLVSADLQHPAAEMNMGSVHGTAIPCGLAAGEVSQRLTSDLQLAHLAAVASPHRSVVRPGMGPAPLNKAKFAIAPGASGHDEPS